MSRRRGFPDAFHVGAIAATGLLLGPRAALADPQASVGVTAGAAIEDVVAPRSPFGAFHLGLRGDVLFLRSEPRQMGLGPYVDVATEGFSNLDAGGGASWLIPALEDLPLVLSAGAFARNGQQRSWAPGLEGTVFLGSRSYNFHSDYGMAFGFFGQTRWVPSTPAVLDVVMGVQLDLELLALPVLFVFEGLR